MKLTKEQAATIKSVTERLEELKSEVDQLWQEVEGEWSDKTEKWKESEKGQAFKDDVVDKLDSWASAIEQAAGDAPETE